MKKIEISIQIDTGEGSFLTMITTMPCHYLIK